MRELALLRDHLDLRLIDLRRLQARGKRPRAIGLRLVAAAVLIVAGVAQAQGVDDERARRTEDLLGRQRIGLVGERGRRRDRERDREAATG
jgi:hypothetical protein